MVPVGLGCSEYRHTGYIFQGESNKKFSFALTFAFHFLNKCTGRIYSLCFVHENCGRFAGISCILIEQEPILVFARSFGFGFCSTPTCSFKYLFCICHGTNFCICHGTNPHILYARPRSLFTLSPLP